MLRAAASVAFAVVLLAAAPFPASAQTPSLDWGSEVNPSRCPTDQGYRYLEVNVTRSVEGDVALTGALNPSGPAWAVRDFNQHIQVWRIGVNPGGGERFCALVRYQGSFTTLAGPSPQGVDTLPAGIEGTFEGGYRLVFNADEGSPAFRTRGHIGDFGPIGLFDWLSFYFITVDTDLNGDLQWWGWIYHGGPNGTWVNSINGNQGGIRH